MTDRERRIVDNVTTQLRGVELTVDAGDEIIVFVLGRIRERAASGAIRIPDVTMRAVQALIDPAGLTMPEV